MRKAFTILVLLTLLLNCKKGGGDVDSDKPKEEAFADKVDFFSNSPNTRDGLIARTQLKKTNSVIYFFGSFNAKGIQDSVKSIVLDNRDSNFLCKYVLDNKNRPVLCYTTKKNGENDNIILKLSYPAVDTVVYSLYNYDWKLDKDSLLQENKINLVNGQGIISSNMSTVGKPISNPVELASKNPSSSLTNPISIAENFNPISTVPATKDDIDPVIVEYQDIWDKWKTSLTNGIIKVQALSGLNRLLTSWTTTITSAITNAAVIDAGLYGTLISIREQLNKSGSSGVNIRSYEEIYGYANDTPSSPTLGSVPNPSGTPQNPLGKQLILGKWKITLNVNNCTGNVNNYSEVMNNKIIEFGGKYGVVSITDQINLTGAWSYENGQLQFYSQMAGYKLRRFSFASKGYAKFEKYFFGTFEFKDDNTIPAFNSVCSGTMRLTKL